MISEFRRFAFRGNLVDIAIGIASGAALPGVVQSLVDNVILALVAAMFGQPSFSGLPGSVRCTRCWSSSSTG